MSSRAYRDVVRLDDDALRGLLRGSDPVERVWAIWALGLRASAGQQLAAHLASEPTPGVRRALAVVLAGQGEVDLLVALAQHDPDVHVRASVMRIVVRFAAAGHVPWSVCVDTLADAAAVRAAVLGELPEHAPPLVRARVLDALHDDDAEVRVEAFGAAVRMRRAGWTCDDALRAWLDADPARDRLTRPRAESERAIARWFAQEPPAGIAPALVGASVELRAHVVGLRPELAWTELAPLLCVDVLDRMLADRTLSIDDAPTVRVLELAGRHPEDAALGAVLEARLRGSVPLDQAARAALALARAALARYLDRLEDPLTWFGVDPDEDDAWIGEERERVGRALVAVDARLARHG